MNIKKYLLAALAGGVSTSIAYVILFFPLNSYLERNILVPAGASSQGSTVSSTVATISIALIMAYIYPNGYEGGSPVSE